MQRPKSFLLVIRTLSGCDIGVLPIADRARFNQFEVVNGGSKGECTHRK